MLGYAILQLIGQKMKYLVKFLMIFSVFFSILYISGCGRISSPRAIEGSGYPHSYPSHE